MVSLLTPVIIMFVFLSDMDVYIDRCIVFVTDMRGDVYKLDMSADSLLVQPLYSQLSVIELTVDWLSPLLYVSTNDSTNDSQV